MPGLILIASMRIDQINNEAAFCSPSSANIRPQLEKSTAILPE